MAETTAIHEAAHCVAAALFGRATVAVSIKVIEKERLSGCVALGWGDGGCSPAETLRGEAICAFAGTAATELVYGKDTASEIDLMAARAAVERLLGVQAGETAIEKALAELRAEADELVRVHRHRIERMARLLEEFQYASDLILWIHDARWITEPLLTTDDLDGSETKRLRIPHDEKPWAAVASAPSKIEGAEDA